MKYIIAYLVISVAASLLIGRFIYVGHTESKEPRTGRLKKGRTEKPAFTPGEPREKVLKD